MLRFSPELRIRSRSGFGRSTEKGTAGRFQLESWELDAACDGTGFVGLPITALVPLAPMDAVLSPAATSYKLGG